MIKLDISFSYPDGTEIFSHLSLEVEKGEHILILGRPGCGKSTLARILTGALPGYTGGKLDGEISIDGVDIINRAPYERMMIIGRVSQNTDEMLLFSSVKEEILFPLLNAGLDDADAKERMESSLALFGLTGYEGVSTSELSGGEKRRLLLAISYAISPSVLVLDESFDDLSPLWRGKLRNEITKSDKTIIVLGSHELGEYSGLFDRTLQIENGKLSSQRKEIIPEFSYKPRLIEESLSAMSLIIERMHKSIMEKQHFELSVPSFSLKRGEAIILEGDNGSGKSTFAHALSGLIAEKSGSIEISGKPLSAKERRRSVAYLMQNPYEELFLPRVSDELESTGKGKEEIEDALSLFSLDGDAYTAELSYGKAKLLQAALFYLLDRPFAVFDEFDSALSYIESLCAMKAFLEKGTGLVVITHDETFASLIPGKRMRIEKGVLR